MVERAQSAKNNSCDTFGTKKYTVNTSLSPLLSVNHGSTHLDISKIHLQRKNQAKTPVRK